MRGFLVDSNILVYAYDAASHAKQKSALEVLDALINDGTAILSVQCLSEFYSTVQRKIPNPLPPDIAFREVQNYIRDCHILDLTASAVLDACRGTAQHDMHFWDALIWSVARLNGVPWVLSEDGQHGRLIEGVRYLNPFHPDFEMSTLAN